MERPWNTHPPRGQLGEWPLGCRTLRCRPFPDGAHGVRGHLVERGHSGCPAERATLCRLLLCTHRARHGLEPGVRERRVDPAARHPHAPARLEARRRHTPPSQGHHRLVAHLCRWRPFRSASSQATISPATATARGHSGATAAAWADCQIGDGPRAAQPSATDARPIR